MKRWHTARGALVCMMLAALVFGPAPVTAGGAAAVAISPSWVVQETVLADGRRYYARVPTCSPATEQACVDYLARPRPVLVFLHAAGGNEDASTAAAFLGYFGTLQRTWVLVYAVSAGGSKVWNGGICCSFTGVDDVGYLVRAVQSLGSQTRVDLARVGVMGYSNGGVLALRAGCQRPDVFRAGASWAGTWVDKCDLPGTNVAQWHGSADTVVPINGGTTYFQGRPISWPPASNLATRMAAGTTFPLTILPGVWHHPPLAIFGWQMKWISERFG